MTDLSPRLGLPLLAAGQAQKEIFHNEALIVLEAMAQPVAETLGDNVAPPTPAVGLSWIVGGAPTGAWNGQSGCIATWTTGGWRFSAPFRGMSFWVVADGLWARRTDSTWELGTLPASALIIDGNQVVGGQQPGIGDPAGGAVIDDEARAAVASILAALRGHGLIAA